MFGTSHFGGGYFGTGGGVLSVDVEVSVDGVSATASAGFVIMRKDAVTVVAVSSAIVSESIAPPPCPTCKLRIKLTFDVTVMVSARSRTLRPLPGYVLSPASTAVAVAFASGAETVSAPAVTSSHRQQVAGEASLSAPSSRAIVTGAYTTQWRVSRT